MGWRPRIAGARCAADKSLPDASGQRRYLFKPAETPREIAGIHRLLYRTFVLEIPRYDDPGTDYLVDKYHERNLYFVAVRNGRVLVPTGDAVIQPGDQAVVFALPSAIKQVDALFA